MHLIVDSFACKNGPPSSENLSSESFLSLVSCESSDHQQARKLKCRGISFKSQDTKCSGGVDHSSCIHLARGDIGTTGFVNLICKIII